MIKVLKSQLPVWFDLFVYYWFSPRFLDTIFRQNKNLRLQTLFVGSTDTLVPIYITRPHPYQHFTWKWNNTHYTDFRTKHFNSHYSITAPPNNLFNSNRVDFNQKSSLQALRWPISMSITRSHMITIRLIISMIILIIMITINSSSSVMITINRSSFTPIQ